MGMSERSDPSVNTQLGETSAAAVREELKGVSGRGDGGRGFVLFPDVPLHVLVLLQGWGAVGKNSSLAAPSSPDSWLARGCRRSHPLLSSLDSLILLI